MCVGPIVCRTGSINCWVDLRPTYVLGRPQANLYSGPISSPPMCWADLRPTYVLGRSQANLYVGPILSQFVCWDNLLSTYMLNRTRIDLWGIPRVITAPTFSLDNGYTITVPPSSACQQHSAILEKPNQE